MQTRSKDYWKLFRPATCSLGLRGSTKEEVFDEILAVFVKGKALGQDLVPAAKRALLEREQLATTGVGQRVAIPHVKLKGLEQAVFGLAVHREGVPWSAPDGELVSILFTVLRPEKPSDQYDPDRHREMISWIALLAREADFRRFALRVTNRTELLELVQEMSARLA
jgi:PTS system fructose-specific IIC component